MLIAFDPLHHLPIFFFREYSLFEQYAVKIKEPALLFKLLPGYRSGHDSLPPIMLLAIICQSTVEASVSIVISNSLQKKTPFSYKNMKTAPSR